MDKLFGICLTKEKLLLIDRNIGKDINLLKQTLVGCIVRVSVQGRPMLADIQSVVESCQIEWAKFGRRLFLPSLGFYEFNQVYSEMPGQDELERWCKRSKQNAPALSSKAFVETKLGLLKFATEKPKKPQFILLESVPVERVGPFAPPVHTDTNARVEENVVRGIDEDEQCETARSVVVSEGREDDVLSDVEGLVQSRELLVQVLLPCDDLLKFVTITNNIKMLTFSLAGCLIAFRIGDREKSSEIIVDEIDSVVNEQPMMFNFRLRGYVYVAKLVAVGESEVTDNVFEQWVQLLKKKKEPMPDVHAKNAHKQHALDRLISSSRNADWAMKILEEEKLPEISSIVVPATLVQLLADNLELVELNRVLTGCFVTVKLNGYVLELEKQPTMRDLFVVPISKVLKDDDKNLILYFSVRILIHHQKTGQQLIELGFENLGDQKLDGTDNLVVRTLFMIKELNIPLTKTFEIPLLSDLEIAQKWVQLDNALVKARKNAAMRPLPAVLSNNGQQQMQQNRRRSASAPQQEQYEKRPKNNLQ